MPYADPERRAQYHRDNAQKARDRAKAWALANPKPKKARSRLPEAERKARDQARSAKWRADNPGRNTEYARGWRAANPGKQNAYKMARRAAVLQATPAWADMAAIERIYEEAALLGMEVDHVYPLRGENVCGLHVENNLQLLTRRDNAVKGNRVSMSEVCSAISDSNPTGR